jgi:osmotically-inducible protein OsmY
MKVWTRALAVAAATLLAVACAQSDAGITTKVKTKLATDNTVKASQVNVDTKDKVVTLTGTVDSDTAKQRAVELARDTTGVRDVVDNLSVAGSSAAGTPPGGADASGNMGSNPGGTSPISDAAITAAVKTKLLADPTVGGLKIDVDTQNGVVTLTSDGMNSQAEIDSALGTARQTEGVKDVQNRMTVKSKKS